MAKVLNVGKSFFVFVFDMAAVAKSAVNYTLWGEGRGWGAGGEGVP